MSEARRLRGNVLSTYAVRAAGIAAGVFLFPFVVRRVGLSEYGLWLLFSSLAALVTTDLGMGTSAIRYVAGVRDDVRALNRLASSTLAFFVAVGLLGSALLALMFGIAWPALDIGPDLRTTAVELLLVALVGNLVLGLPFVAFRNLLIGLERQDVANLCALAQIGLRVTFTIGVLVTGHGIVAVALGEVLATIAAGVLLVLASHRLVPGLRVTARGVSVSLLRSMGSHSADVFVVAVSAVVLLQTDSLLIGLFLPVGLVTLYAAAFRMYQLCRALPGAFILPLVPIASRTDAAGGRERMRELFVTGTRYANGLTLLVAVPAAVLAEPLLALWVGERFAEHAAVAQILLVSLLLNSNHLVALALLMGAGRLRPYARYHAFWALSNLVLTVLLIQPLGLVGVALGTAIPVLLLEPLYVRTALRELGVRPRVFIVAAVVRPLVPALAAAAALVAGVEVWQPERLTGVLLAAAAYAALFAGGFAVVALDRGERRALRNRVRPARNPSRAPAARRLREE